MTLVGHPMSRVGKSKREREEACYICGHYHDVSHVLSASNHVLSTRFPIDSLPGAQRSYARHNGMWLRAPWLHHAV